MSEPKKVDRRKFIYAGLGAVALIAIGAAAYVAMNPPVVTQTVTTSTTSLVTTTVPTTSVVTSTVPTTSVVTSTITTSPTKPVTLTLIGEEHGMAVKVADMVALFEQLHPNIKINHIELEYSGVREKCRLDMMSGATRSAYDIVYGSEDAIMEFADAGYIEPIDDIVEPILNKFISPKVIQGAYYKGHYWAMQQELKTWLFYYRTDVYGKAGLNGPPKTIDEFKEYAKLTSEFAQNKDLDGDGKIDVYGVIADLLDDNDWGNINLFSQMFGAKPENPLYSDDFKKSLLDSEPVIEAVRFFKELLDSKAMDPESLNITSTGVKATTFQAGKASNLWNWDYSLAWNDDPQKSLIRGKWNASLMPGSKYGKSFALFSRSYYMVTAKSPYKEEAKEFLRFLCSNEYQDLIAKTGNIPWIKGFAEKYPTKWSGLIQEQLASNATPGFLYYTKYDVDVYKAADPWWHKAYRGEISVEEACKRAAEEANKILAGGK
jgi:multiple sugar transport system substrate-binding protein